MKREEKEEEKAKVTRSRERKKRDFGNLCDSQNLWMPP